MIKVSNVSKIYKNKKESIIALNDISFELPSKGFVGLSGENGCGKTTFLNLLSTLDYDFSGEIFIDNLNVRDNRDYIRKKVISFVLQDDFFISNLSVLDNIMLINSKSDLSQLKSFNMEDKINKYTYELSGGQKQKVSLIRGLEKEFDILLVDEPTSSLDENTTKNVFELLSNIAKDKLVILVSHDMEMMNAYCNLIIRLNSGKVEYIKNNITVSDVNYDDDGVTFYGDVNLHSISLEKMNDILDRKEHFIIKKEKQINKININYNKKDYVVEDDKIDKTQRKLLFKSYFKKTLPSSIVFSVLVSILLLLFETFFDFRFYNSNDFLYKSLIKNQDSYLICDQDVVKSEEDFINKEILNNFAKKHSFSIDYSDQINTDLSFGFKEFSIYRPFIVSFVSTDFKNYDFAAGTAPVDNSKIVITDYIADALIISNSYYSNYEDIISEGIFLGSQNISVSGIIDTNYEQYKNEKLSKKDSFDFLYYYNSVFASIFYLDSFVGNEYEAFFIKNVDSFVKLKIDESIGSMYCKVNDSLAAKMNYSGDYKYPIKTPYGEYYVDGIVEDFSEQDNIYFSSDIKHDIESSDSFDYFMLNLDNKEVFDYLVDKNISFICYSYSYAMRVIDVINLLQKLFVVFISIILIAMSLYFIGYFKRIDFQNKNLYCITRFNGFKFKNYIINESKVLLIYIATTVLLNTLLYFGIYGILNLFLTITFEIDVIMFNYNFWTPFIGMLVFVLILLIVYIIRCFKKKNKNLIKFIR